MDTLITEVWKETKYPNIFVSNLGNVKRRDGFIYSKCVCISNHYNYVHLQINGKHIAVKVARLVAEAFIPNTEDKPCVDHINTIRNDDRVENLKWCTHSENMRNPITIKHCKNARPKEMPKRRIPVLQYDKNGNFLREWDGTTSFGKTIGKDVCGNIIACIKGKQKTAYGYIWKYKTENFVEKLPYAKELIIGTDE